MTADWRWRGACRDHPLGPNAWFPHNESPKNTRKLESVCAVCPVRLACLAEGLRRDGFGNLVNKHGVWGGLTTKQREEATT